MTDSVKLFNLVERGLYPKSYYSYRLAHRFVLVDPHCHRAPLAVVQYYCCRLALVNTFGKMVTTGGLESPCLNEDGHCVPAYERTLFSLGRTDVRSDGPASSQGLR